MGQGKSAFKKKYKLKETLGKGHFATVYRVVQRKSGEEYALKVISKKELKEKDKRWLESEIEILQSVNHTNICRLIEVFETGDKLYLVLEMLRGGDLLARVSEDPDFTQKDTADVIRTVAGVLRYIHAKGIIHRDIKPQNLVYRGKEKGSQLVVTDFGLSKHMAVDDITYTACGTPLYLAPEVILKSGYGKECDMWSLGVLLYVLLTGYFPFYSRTRHKLYSKVLECRYKWPKEAKDVPPEAKDLVSKLLCVDPKKRYTPDQVLKHPWISLDAKVAAAGDSDSSINTVSRRNLKLMNAKLKFKKAVSYLIDIIRFIHVFSLLPEEVQARYGKVMSAYNAKIKKRRASGSVDESKNPALATIQNLAKSLVDGGVGGLYTLVYKQNGDTEWTSKSSRDKKSLTEQTFALPAGSFYFLFKGPEPEVKAGWKEADIMSYAKRAILVDTAQNKQVQDGALSSTTVAQIKKLTTGIQADDMVKLTTKVIASSLFSPKPPPSPGGASKADPNALSTVKEQGSLEQQQQRKVHFQFDSDTVREQEGKRSRSTPIRASTQQTPKQAKKKASLTAPALENSPANPSNEYV